MKSLKKVVALGAVASLVALGGCSAGGTTAADGTETITFMGWGSPEEVNVFKTMIAQFEKDYPKIKVDYQTVPADNFNTKLQTLIAGKKTPDVFYLTGENLQPFAKNGVIADLSDFTKKNDVFEESNVWPNELDMWRYDGTTAGKGAIYAYPKDIGPIALAYNKELFAKAGIPTPDPAVPWTWDEFVANAKKITSGSGPNKVYGTSPYNTESAIWSSGADYLNADRTKVTVTDPKFTEAMQWIADLSLKHGVAPTSEEESSLGSLQRFEQGKVGMMGIGPWFQAIFWKEVKFDWDLMPWPVPKAGDEQATWYGGIGFGVSKSSAHLKAAQTLAAYLAFDREAQKTNMELGQAVPSLIDMAKSEYLAMDKPPANKQVWLDIIEKYGRPPTQTQSFNGDWWGIYHENASDVWTGKKTAAAYSKEVQAEMQKSLDQAIEKSQK